MNTFLRFLLMGTLPGLLQSLFIKKSGKKFAIIGPAGAGKTTFIHFLRNGEAPAPEYESTEAPTKIKSKEFDKFEIPIDDITDLPGHKDFHTDWQQHASKADVICYLFDAHRLLQGDSKYIELVTSEMRHVNEWRKERTKQNTATRFFIIGTHLDQISDYRNMGEIERSQYILGMWKSPIFEKLNRIGGGAAARCLAGSLSDTNGCERLIKRVLNELEAMA